MDERVTGDIGQKPNSGEQNAISQTGNVEQSITGGLRFEPESQTLLVHSVDDSGEQRERSHPFQDFLYSLRTEGVNASTSEWLDVQKCLAEGEVHSLDDLYIVARTLLVKNVANFSTFDTVFGRMFYGIEPPKPKDEWEDDDEQEVEQKDKEDVNEVVEATSQTSEDVHGGNEATKDIEDSPNAANEGKDQDNKGAEKGKSEKDQNAKGKGSGKEQKSSEAGGGKNNKEAGGGKRLEDKKGVIQEGRGGFSSRERVLKRKYDVYDKDKILGYEQFGQVLAKLTAIIQDSTAVRTPKLDQLGTVRSIAREGGVPEFVWKEESEEKPKVMVLFDVGGSTDDFRPIMEKLFAAAKDTIDELDIYYFHNAIYGDVWPQTDGNYGKNFIPVNELLKKDDNTRVILVGDAWMADNELFDEYRSYDQQGNPTYSPAGIDSFGALRKKFPHIVWINPILEKEHDEWDRSGTISAIKGIFPMYDLTLHGLENGVKKLMED